MVVPCGIGWVRWPAGWLSFGTLVGPTCQVCRGCGSHLVEVDQYEAATWHSCAEVAQSGGCHVA
jgi:hypothetical protein